MFDRHLHTRELQGVFSSLAELFFQVKQHAMDVSPILSRHASPPLKWIAPDDLGDFFTVLTNVNVCAFQHHLQ